MPGTPAFAIFANMDTINDNKCALLARNPVDIYVIAHKNEDGTVEYISSMKSPAGAYMWMNIYVNWFEADWYESRAEAESQIAESARDTYSVEHVHISRDPLERGVTITKEPPKAHFKCACGCEFSASSETCKTTHSNLEGDTSVYSTVTFWLKCPRCGHECSDMRIK